MRYLFPDDRVALRVSTAGGPLASASGATVLVYADPAGTQLADITDRTGAPIAGSALTVDDASMVPEFYGPDGEEQLWVTVGGGPVSLVNPVKLVGPAGAAGPAGPQGAPGPVGPVGPAGLTWRGPWNSAVGYDADDAVYYGGSTYFAVAASTGVTPGSDPDAWATLAIHGQDGAAGPAGPQGVSGPTGPQGPPGPPGTGTVLRAEATDDVGSGDFFNGARVPGTQLTLSSGTWLLVGQVTFACDTGQDNDAFIYDETNGRPLAAAEWTAGTKGGDWNRLSVPISVPLTVSGPTQVGLRAATPFSTVHITRGGGTVTTYLTAVKLA